jgi:DDE superfamily endonuclease
MSPAKRYARKQAKAIKRRRLHAKERHERQQRQAQRDIEALHQALQELGFPDDLVAEIEGRLRSQKKLLGTIFALMFPTLFGSRSAHELTRVRGWDQNWPSRILGALPKRSWLKRLRKLGQDIVTAIWRRAQSMSPATRSRWQLTPVIDDSVFRKYGGPLELVGHWYSGQYKRVVSGIDGVLLLMVVGDGQLVVPIHFARRPNPNGPGRRCRTKLEWTQTMLDETLAALARRGLELPPPIVVADSWLSDSKLMGHVANSHQGTLLVQGKTTYTFYLEDGRIISKMDALSRRWTQSPRARLYSWRHLALATESACAGGVTMSGFGPRVRLSGR